VNLDFVGPMRHIISRQTNKLPSGEKMSMEQIIGFAILAQLSIGTILYSMGYRDGKSVGYHHGRSIGMAMGKTKVAK
jgi:hypothetical protein